MGRKNRGNSKFWSHKKFFPPGTVMPEENNATSLIWYLENRFDLLLLKVLKTNAKA